MSDNTPNPYESSVLAVNNESASGGNHALIDSLDVSERWKRKFHVMDDLNSITDPKEKKAYFKSLTDLGRTVWSIQYLGLLVQLDLPLCQRLVEAWPDILGHLCGFGGCFVGVEH